jgi:flagellar hook-length control protein FliK
VALDSVLSTPVIPPPPKGATSPTGGNSSSPGSDGSSSSSSATSSSSGADSSRSTPAPSNSTRSSAKGDAQSNAGQTPNTSAASNKAQQQNATNQAQGTSSAANAAHNAATQNKNQGPSFIQALAQTQADAQGSATATVAAAPQEFTNTKPKGTKNDPDTIGTALGFLPQSLAAAMAGLQPASAGQNLPGDTTSDNDSSDAVAVEGRTTIQSVIADMAQGTAEELKTATDGKADPSAAPTTDNTASAAANAFQAHMVAKAPTAENTDKISTPVGNTGFADEVGDKITWMASQGIQSASLQMTPEHLGPVEVRISMQQDGTASVSFTAAHADTRAALEQALPQLREMFSTQGLTLADASVSHQSPRGQPQQRQAVNAIGAIGGGSSDDPTSSSIASVTRVQSGLLDTYA